MPADVVLKPGHDVRCLDPLRPELIQRQLAVVDGAVRVIHARRVRGKLVARAVRAERAAVLRKLISDAGRGELAAVLAELIVH